MVTILLFFVGILHMLRLFLVVIFALFSCSLSVVANAEEEIGHYTMNGVTFAIPKKVLLVKVPEGEVDDIIPLLLHWPDMEPAEWKGDQSKVIHVSIRKGGYSRTPMASGEKVTPSYQWYGIISDIFDTEIISEEKRLYKQHIKAKPIFLYQAKGLGLDYYKLPYVGHPNVYEDDFFIRGNPLKPEYWIHCNLTRCDSAFELNDHISVRYSHQRFGFLQGKVHEEIRQAIIDKLSSFIIPPKGE